MQKFHCNIITAMHRLKLLLNKKQHFMYTTLYAVKTMLYTWLVYSWNKFCNYYIKPKAHQLKFSRQLLGKQVWSHTKPITFNVQSTCTWPLASCAELNMFRLSTQLNLTLTCD